MALNVDSVFRVGLSSINDIVNALLNDGWRFLVTAANIPPPTNPLPNTPEIITYVLDNSWDSTNAVLEANRMNAIDQAFAAWSNVANIVPDLGPLWDVANFDANAEIVLHLTAGANIFNFGGYSGTAGEATQTTNHVNGTTTLLVADHGRVHTYIATDGWQRGNATTNEPILDPTTGQVSPGGLQLIIHEIGHALGLKHPHDDGADGTPDLTDTDIFLPGVPEGGVNNAGTNNLNVTVNTLMSYNNAITTLAGPIQNIAVVSTPMAFDIAAIQYLYGANTNSHTGNDTYVLNDTSWSCIWDAGGIDEIVCNSSVDAVINLNPATLDNSSTGGGLLSYLKSTTTAPPTGATNWATGGLTIAGDVTNALPDQIGITGVIIENASGGDGNDEITGNAAENKLLGNGGADTLDGDSGNDFLDGGAGDDELFGWAGNDILHGGPGADLIGGGSGADQFDHLDIATFASAVTINLQTGQHTGEAAGDFYVSIEQFNGSPESDTMVASLLQSIRFAGGDGADILIGGDQSDWLQGGRGGDYLDGGNGFSDIASYADAPSGITVDLGFSDGTTDGKVSAGEWGFDTLVSIESIEGTEFSDYIVGDEGENKLFGLGDGDYLQGGTGDDTLTGGSGGDTFAFRTGDGTDTIKDFNIAEGDKLDLSGTAFSSFDDLQAQGLITQQGSNTIITLGSGLVLENFTAATLTSAQFLFNAPTDIALSPASVAENSAVGTVVGALSATDVDLDDTFTFELLDNPDGLFSIDGANLVVAGALDYEAAASHSILVQVTDSDGNAFRELITVEVIDFNVEAHPDSYTTNEDTALVEEAAGVLANDADEDGDSLSAILVGGPSHGTLTLNANGSFTYAPDANYNGQDSFTYKANDGTSDSNIATVSITVNPVNDAPVIQSGGGGAEATYFVRVNNTAITTVVATDVDGDDISYSIVDGSDANLFVIDSDTGELTFSSFPIQPNKSYFVNVQADDGNGGSDIQAIKVNVTADKMIAEIAPAEVDTFVFHAGFGANTVQNFDVAMDILQFDSGMFAADSAAAVLAAAHETKQGDVIIDTHAGQLQIIGVTLTQLQAQGEFVFV